jgi:hypothetical protein
MVKTCPAYPTFRAVASTRRLPSPLTLSSVAAIDGNSIVRDLGVVTGLLRCELDELDLFWRQTFEYDTAIPYRFWRITWRD